MNMFLKDHFDLLKSVDGIKKDKDHLDKFNIFMGYLGNNVKCDSYRCR